MAHGHLLYVHYKEDKEMTMKEAVARWHPEAIKEDCCGGVFGCPSWYGLEKQPPTKCHLNHEYCRCCWNRTYVAVKNDESEA